jgi:spore maturation protein CgeB
VNILIFGLSITSSWGNGHATTYRALAKALHQRKHRIIFFEKNQEWYASNRDLPNPNFCEVRFYEDWLEALPSMRRELETCDVALLGSYFPDGIRAAQEVLESNAPVKAFYDIDTPITIANLRAGGTDYLQSEQVEGFDLYFSFTGGPLLAELGSRFGARNPVPLYCSFDPEQYFPRGVYSRYRCDLSYMGTYAADRQPKLDQLFSNTAKQLSRMKFLLAGPQYPAKLKWPRNIRRIRHLSPRWHPHFYSSSRLTLNLTRSEMVRAGFSPSVRLFEAAACGATIVSDAWPGLETFFEFGEEILVADSTTEIADFLKDADHSEIRRIGQRARARVLAEHSSAIRALEFENWVAQAKSSRNETQPAARSAATSVSPRDQEEEHQPFSPSLAS